MITEQGLCQLRQRLKRNLRNNFLSSTEPTINTVPRHQSIERSLPSDDLLLIPFTLTVVRVAYIRLGRVEGARVLGHRLGLLFF